MSTEADIILGGWEIKPSEGMPQRVATAFSEVTGKLKGATYKPLMYCGSQIVNGTNHMIICKQTLVTNPPHDHVVKFVLNISWDGKASIVAIDTIV